MTILDLCAEREAEERVAPAGMLRHLRFAAVPGTTSELKRSGSSVRSAASGSSPEGSRAKRQPTTCQRVLPAEEK